jgi:hypothetical protein
MLTRIAARTTLGSAPTAFGAIAAARSSTAESEIVEIRSRPPPEKIVRENAIEVVTVQPADERRYDVRQPLPGEIPAWGRRDVGEILGGAEREGKIEGPEHRERERGEEERLDYLPIRERAGKRRKIKVEPEHSRPERDLADRPPKVERGDREPQEMIGARPDHQTCEQGGDLRRPALKDLHEHDQRRAEERHCRRRKAQGTCRGDQVSESRYAEKPRQLLHQDRIASPVRKPASTG